MRKIAVFARGLMMSVCVLLTMTACSEEELVAPEENGGADNNTTITTPTDIPMKTIRISAGMAQGEDGEMTRTTLNGQKVVWDEGDEYTIINEDYVEDSKTLRIRLNEGGSGLAVKAGSTTHFKYEDLKVVIGGEDVTQKIMSTNTADNEFFVGATNYERKYQYTTLNTTMQAHVYSNDRDYNVVIARCSESRNILSTDKEAIITIKGIQWGSKTNVNNNKGTLLTQKTTQFVTNGKLSSGTTIKMPADYYWLQSIRANAHLTSNAGKTYGDFEGQIPEKSEIDNKTLAIYPTSACQSYEKGEAILNIPNTQSYVNNSFDRKANIMIGKFNLEKAEDDIYDATFKNMMGVLQLSLTGDDELSTITLTDKAGLPLWGTAKLPVSNYEEGISTDMITGGNSSIVLNCEGVKLTSEPTTFHFVVPAGAFVKGFDALISTKDNKEYILETTSNNLIAVNSIKKMPQTEGIELERTLNLHNEAVATYLSYTEAPSFDQSVSLIAKYPTLIANKFLDQDHPQYYNITWDGNANANYYIDFRDDTKKQYVYEHRETKGSSYSFINMIPYHTYTYTVKDSNNNIIKSGKFKTTGHVREITIEDSWNYRDLGGWTSTLGGMVQYEWLYRGGSLNGEWTYAEPSETKYKAAVISNTANYKQLSLKSQEQIQDLGITGELDLRSTSKENTGDDLPHSLALGTGVSNTGIPNWTYKQIRTNQALSYPTSTTYNAFVQDVEYLIDEVLAGHPIAFHCKSGADRTGALSLIILGLLGVDESDVARDYELTNYSHEQSVVIGKSEFRDRKANTGEVYKFYNGALKGINSPTNGSLQERCYYYLNQRFSSKKISKDKLDKFINKMLGKPEGTYQGPSWAK